MDALIQFLVFGFLTGLVGLLTYLTCRKEKRMKEAREYFLAGGSLSWIYIAGSITLTNISTDTLVGWNGNQMVLIVWWELASIVGLLLLAKVFVPIYYRYGCTTVTELLERRYRDKHIRAMVAALFLLGNIFLFLPTMLYTSSLVIKSMFGLEVPLLMLASGIAVLGAAYAVLGGLRAVAISDTYSGVIVLGMALLVAVLALNRVDWNWAGVPAERLTLIGGPDSALPWTTLLTGMIYTQLFYWSTNQTITQRALAAPTIREAQKGVLVAASLRLLIVPAMVVIPGICAFKLFGRLGDATYGRIVAEVLPQWLQGAFAAGMVAAVVTSYNAVLNSSAALYVCDLHQKFINPNPNVPRMSAGLQAGFTVLSIALVPVYVGADSIIQLIQQLLGLLSMPILSAFITGLLFRNVDARAVMATVVFGTALYGVFTFVWTPTHFLHLMAVTVWACVGFALLVNRVVFGRRAEFEFRSAARRREILAVLRSDD
jgi:SSS family solute:Na+ symporter